MVSMAAPRSTALRDFTAPDIVYATAQAEYVAQQRYLRDLDAVRRRLRLSNGQWARLLGGVATDDQRLRRAAEIVPLVEIAQRLWPVYLDQLHRAVDAEVERAGLIVDGEPRLTTVQVARALNCSDFHIANLKRRGRIPALNLNSRTAAFRAEDIHAFVESPHAVTTSSSPVTGGFMRYLHDRHPELFGHLVEREYWETNPSLSAADDAPFVLVRSRLGNFPEFAPEFSLMSENQDPAPDEVEAPDDPDTDDEDEAEDEDDDAEDDTEDDADEDESEEPAKAREAVAV